MRSGPYAEAEKTAARVVESLQEMSRNNDRGSLALLRRGLSAATRCYAWQVLSRFGSHAMDNIVFETVAGCFALHPDHSDAAGNLGATLSRIVGDKDQSDARFRRLLACSHRDEICMLVRSVVKLAKARDRMAVNYRQLFVDLSFWNDRTKAEWAKSYWATPDAPAEFGCLDDEDGGVV